MTDKSYLPEKTLSLHSHWEIDIAALAESVSTRGENGERVRGRIKPKRGKHRPAPLRRLPSPSPANLEVAQAASPMGIHPAPFPRLDATSSRTRPVNSGDSNNEQKTLQGFGRCQEASVNLGATRFFVEKGFLDVET